MIKKICGEVEQEGGIERVVLRGREDADDSQEVGSQVQ